MSDYHQECNVWEDYEATHQVNQENATMAAKKQQPAVTTHHIEAINNVSLLSLVEQLDEYSRKQIVEGFVRGVVTELARTEVMSDSVEIGEDCVMDLKGERPGPDSVAEGRTLSEKQIEFLGRLNNNMEVLTDIVALLAETYEANEGELPPFGLVQISGEWKTVKELSKAKDHEYRRTVQAKLKKAESAKENGFNAEGARTIIAEQRQKAAKKASRFG